MSDVTFPSGVTVRATALADRQQNDCWRTFGLYLDRRWNPSWSSCVLDWPDFGLPEDWEFAAFHIKHAFDLATSGERVEVGCAGGLGRTGTVLACMAILSGVQVKQAVTWVRANYDRRAVETDEQEKWVLWFGNNASKDAKPD